MPEFSLKPVHALATAPMGRFGATDGTAPLVMTAPAEGAVLQILESGTGDIATALAGHGNFVLRPCGPGQWFAVADAPLDPGARQKIETALDGMADVIDQSAGRVRIVIEGEHVRAALAKGVPVDLHPDVFETGRTATTLCGHVTINLTRTDGDRFEILVMRSYAAALWESLIEMGLEYGIDCHHL